MNKVHKGPSYPKGKKKVQGIQKVPKGPGLWGGQTNRQTDTQTERHTHQYHDSAWPRGQAD